jgi:CheY-like chemotaxis protein
MADAVTLRRPTILLVEDDDSLRGMVRLALVLAGFDTREARSGLEALAMIDRWRPDLVVLDLVLPGVDGLSVREELASHAGTRSLPVVIITGSQLPLDNVEAECVLRKPFKTEALVEVVQKCLARSGR